MYLYQQFGIELARDLHRERLEAAERHSLAKQFTRSPFAGFRKGSQPSPRDKKPSPAFSVKPVRL